MKIYLLLGVLILSGCATISNDEMVPIRINALEPGTKVKVNGQTFETPATVSFMRGQGDQPIRFSKEGEADQIIILREDADSAMWGNVFWPVLGLIFLAVDTSTGKGYTLNPEIVNFSFKAPTGLIEDQPKAAAKLTGFEGP